MIHSRYVLEQKVVSLPLECKSHTHINTSTQKATIVLLVLKDSVALARKVLDALGQEVDIKEILRPAGLGSDWLLGEIATREPNSGNEA